jgi:hypothetical protein
LHLVWGGLTLHLTEDQFLILVSLVNSTHRQIREEREHAAADAVAVCSSHLM